MAFSNDDSNKNTDKKELYSAPRWNDTSLPEVIGHIDFTEEEKEKYGEEAIAYLKKKGYDV